MEKDKVISHFIGLGYEPILSETTGDVNFYEVLPNTEIIINEHTIKLHFPTVDILTSRLDKHANFNEVMDWIYKQYKHFGDLRL